MVDLYRKTNFKKQIHKETILHLPGLITPETFLKIGKCRFLEGTTFTVAKQFCMVKLRISNMSKHKRIYL